MKYHQVAIFCAACLGLVWLAGTAEACPMCSQSIAEDDSLPRAFMYSILFMLGMPATVLCGIGSVIFVKYRRFYAASSIGIAGDDLVPTPEFGTDGSDQIHADPAPSA
ncbi:MAG: hypothetical protein JSS02_06850 [Planctomycetes bacterium]|nr:hypothetical protein [Planctomycetota bacterium]